MTRQRPPETMADSSCFEGTEAGFDTVTLYIASAQLQPKCIVLVHKCAPNFVLLSIIINPPTTDSPLFESSLHQHNHATYSTSHWRLRPTRASSRRGIHKARVERCWHWSLKSMPALHLEGRSHGPESSREDSRRCQVSFCLSSPLKPLLTTTQTHGSHPLRSPTLSRQG